MAICTCGNVAGPGRTLCRKCRKLTSPDDYTSRNFNLDRSGWTLLDIPWLAIVRSRTWNPPRPRRRKQR